MSPGIFGSFGYEFGVLVEGRGDGGVDMLVKCRWYVRGVCGVCHGVLRGIAYDFCWEGVDSLKMGFMGRGCFGV